jgi:hypothetical protein
LKGAFRTGVVVLAATAALTVTACGSSGGAVTETAVSTQAALPPDAPQKVVIAHQFPKPKPLENAPPGAAKAIAAGRKACKGRKPKQVVDEYIARASKEGSLNEGQEEMLAEIGQYEKQSKTSPDFAAGQLAAGVYEATLPEELARSGYQGCVYELALQLRRELG